MVTNDSEQQKRRAIASVLARDGSIVEMVARDGRTALALNRNGECTEHNELDVPGIGPVRPYAATNNLLSHGVVLFPSRPEPAGTDDELLEAVRAFIHRYSDVSEAFEELASIYVLLTWVYDAFSEICYLRLRGGYGSGKTRTLQTIGSICYKPMFLSGASSVSSMFRIIDAFRGTLVLDESDFRASDERTEVIKILNNGNAAGFPVLRSEATPQKEYNPTAFNVYGPKIIATRGEFDDRALESRCITEIMSGLPPRRDIPISLPKAFRSEAETLRNRLLTYRFRTFNRIRSADEGWAMGIEPRIAQVFSPMIAVATTEGSRSRLIALARRRSIALNNERAASVEAELLGVVAELRREKLQLGMKAISERFVARYGADYQRPITPRWIGAQLRRRLSLVPIKRNGTFELIHDDPRLVALFERFGLEDFARDVGTSEI